MKNNVKDKLKKNKEEKKNKLDANNKKDSNKSKDKKKLKNKESGLFLKNNKIENIFLEKSNHNNKQLPNLKNKVNGKNSLISTTKVMIPQDQNYPHLSMLSDSSLTKDPSKL